MIRMTEAEARAAGFLQDDGPVDPAHAGVYTGAVDPAMAAAIGLITPNEYRAAVGLAPAKGPFVDVCEPLDNADGWELPAWRPPMRASGVVLLMGGLWAIAVDALWIAVMAFLVLFLLVSHDLYQIRILHERVWTALQAPGGDPDERP